MPTYDYECQKCGHTCEIFQSITEAPRRKCPECGKNGLKRLIGSGAGVIFKGSGFYETDYRSEAYKARAKADPDSGGSEKSSSADTDGKKPSEAKTSEKKTETKTSEKQTSENKTSAKAGGKD